MSQWKQSKRVICRLAAAFTIATCVISTTSINDASADTRLLAVQSVYPGGLVQLGPTAKRVIERINTISQGSLKLEFYGPNELVPPLQTFDAVSEGVIQAGWSSPGFWAGVEPALQLFSAVPFGPEAGEYFAWMYFGGGHDMMNEIYAKHDIHSVICGVLAPEASGWFRREISSVEDLQGLRMRFFGLGAKVMERLGVSTTLIAPGDVFPALELGSIDATEFSMPAIDLQVGFYQVADHYYFPGWHQQTTLLELMFNKGEWESMTDLERLIIETACGDSLRYGQAEGEYIQFGALKELQERGVQIHRWSPEILSAMRDAWDEVIAEEITQDETFARVWESYSTFRNDYAIWGRLGYLPR